MKLDGASLVMALLPRIICARLLIQENSFRSQRHGSCRDPCRRLSNQSVIHSSPTANTCHSCARFCIKLVLSVPKPIMVLVQLIPDYVVKYKMTNTLVNHLSVSTPTMLLSVSTMHRQASRVVRTWEPVIRQYAT
ncbi:hypothetical protein B0T13DRAFT_145266 [Neurospora crassa]|nr:hypothetical protein B0T13DRAFT_145266 [Neurospora crassa]